MEIEKELRLPNGIKSWWDLLQRIPDQDEIALMHRPPDSRIGITTYQRQYDPHSFQVPELFEADVLTLKVRGFDELKEIIPGRKELMNMYHEVRYLSGNLGSEKTCEFLEKLINLT